MEPFADAYLAGRTPIPCVGCNQRFKFRHLLERARALGAAAVATGHYARIERDPASGALALLRGVDARKDQSYFLFDLRPEQLAQIRFPVGALGKDEVRARARTLGLAVADKAESQELCFVPDGDTAAAVERLRPGRAPGAGDVVDETGRVVGRHEGIHRFTVGQRRGSRSQRATGLRQVDRRRAQPRDDRAATARRAARVSGVSWVAGAAPDAPLRATVRFAIATPARRRREALADGGARVVFGERCRPP
jgi:tRNA-specific 2-thiouridylase